MRHALASLPLLTALASLALIGCSTGADIGNSKNTANNGLTAGLDVFLSTTNGSNVVAALQELNISVYGVAAHAAGGGWQIVSEEAVVVDLLRLQDSAEALGFSNLPEGKITQIRLYVADDDVSHAVDPDGALIPVTVPSGFQSGVKLKGPFDLGECEYGSAVAILDLEKSIHIHGRGNHDDLVLRPTIHKTDYTAVDAEFCDPGEDGGDGPGGPGGGDDGDGGDGDDGDDGNDNNDADCPPNTEGCGGSGITEDGGDGDGTGVGEGDGVGEGGSTGGDGGFTGDDTGDADDTGDGTGDGTGGSVGDGTPSGDGTGGSGDGTGGSVGDGTAGSGEDACAPVLTEVGLVLPCE